MKDGNGKLLTTEKEFKAEAAKYFTNVFENKPADKDVKQHSIDREKLCKLRLKESAQKKTPLWTSKDVKCAIKDLNKGTYKYSYGIPYELYQEGIVRDGLLAGVVTFMIKIKENPMEYPSTMEQYNVTSIYKNKGDRSNYNSHRGVLRTHIRHILDRLIYNGEYNTVDQNLTDCNVGLRKKCNIRDNLFVMNAIMNSSKQGTDKPCTICVYDISKCFDSQWLAECINDLYSVQRGAKK